jgi:hypothetical protein
MMRSLQANTHKTSACAGPILGPNSSTYSTFSREKASSNCSLSSSSLSLRSLSSSSLELSDQLSCSCHLRLNYPTALQPSIRQKVIQWTYIDRRLRQLLLRQIPVLSSLQLFILFRLDPHDLLSLFFRSLGYVREVFTV